MAASSSIWSPSGFLPKKNTDNSKTFVNSNTAQLNPFTKSGEYVDTFQYLQDTADPFNSERGHYTQQLRSLMDNPGSVAANPAYKWSFDQGNESLNRTLAATGNRGSGRAYSEAMDYGQGKASEQFFQLADLLAGLSGGKQNPAAGSSAMIDMYGTIANERQGIRSTTSTKSKQKSSSNFASFGGGYGSGTWA